MTTFTTAERRALAAKGQAMPDGGYPIRNKTDLENAYKDWARTGKPANVAAWIGRRARQLNLPNPVTAGDGEGGSDRKPSKDERDVARTFMAARGGK